MRRTAVYTIREGLKKRKNLFVKVFLPAFIIALGAVGLYTITTAPGAAAAPVCINDTAGANDEPGQKDLTKLCVDYAGVPTTVQTVWNWDDTGTNGVGQSLDACSLFDTDNDGKVNYSVCVTTSGDPAVFASLTTYSCGDDKIDRCTSPSSVVSSGTTSCSVSILATNPFDAGNDAVGNCTVQLSTVGGSGAKLIDVCSYPSQEPGSDPSDCVIAQPKSAKLEVKKILVPAINPGLFNLQVDSVTKAANIGDGGTTGEVIVTADNNDSTHVVGETAGTGTSLGSYSISIECRDQNGTGDVVASGNTPSTNVTVTDAADIVCIITNTAITTTITTTLKDVSNTTVTEGSSVALGSVIHDTATVSLTPSTAPTGSVTFRFYNTVADCTEDTNFSGGVTKGTIVLDGNNPGIASPSQDTGTLGAGTYAFKANWPGSGNYPGATSSCEPFTVIKADLTVATAVHNAADEDKTSGSVPLGSIMHDTATITGGVDGLPLPSVSFTLTSNYIESCSGGAAVANDGMENGAYKSADSSALGAGAYAYRAVVASNGNYNGDTGDCEPFSVNKAQLGVTTAVHNSGDEDITNDSVSLGSVVHDTATVSGAVNGFTVPAVSFTLTGNYNRDCSQGSPVANDGTEGDAYKSVASTALSAGSYAYQASIAGNDNYIGADGECEPFTVNKADLSIVTDIHNEQEETVTSVDAGTTVHDKATVSGLVDGFTPTNNVAFAFFTDGDCETGSQESAGSVAIDNGVAHPSDSRTSLNGGSYAFLASYDGSNDPNYNSANGLCEPLTVNTLSPDIVTTPNPGEGVSGVVLNDSANLTGGYNPTGTITFRLYGAADTTCEGEPVFTNIVSVDGNGIYNTSEGFTSNGPGTWRWIAEYNGDANNEPVSDNCDDEQVTLGVVLGDTTDKEPPPPVVLGESTSPPQVLAANTGTNIVAESLIALGLMLSTLLAVGYSRFAHKQN